MMGEASVASSAVYVKTAAPYDPYEFRTDGTLGNFMAFIHLVKCSFGTGVLAFPYGFRNAGVVGGFVIGIFVSVFVLWCFHILIKCMMKIAAEEQTPYIQFSEAVKYSFTQVGGNVAKFGRFSTHFIDAVIAMYHFGVCTAYIMFLVKTTMILLDYREETTGAITPTRSGITLVWVLPLFMVNCFRDMKMLFPLSLVGNVTTLVSMVIIVFFIFYPEGTGWDSWEYAPHQHIITAPLFIGQVLFAVESFGVILSIEKSMAKPKHFGGYFGVFNLAMSVVVVWYLFIGSCGYMRFGSQIHAEITLTIESAFLDKEDPYLKGFPIALQWLMGIALYCSYPLQCYVVFDILWNKYINPALVKKGKGSTSILAAELSFRFLVTLASGQFIFIPNSVWYLYLATLCNGIIGLTIPRLDLIISLVGCICITILGLIIPATLELNLTNRKDEEGKRPKNTTPILAKDGTIMGVGTLFFLIGSYCAIYSMVTHTG